MPPPELSASLLEPVAAAALGQQCTVDDGSWSLRPIGHRVRNPVTGGLYHVSGTAIDTHGVSHRWSALLKVLRNAEGAPAWLRDDGEPGHWNNWEREVLAYRSGLTADLADGLSAPRYLHSFQPDAGSWWLWIEYVDGEPGTTWPPDRYPIAAYHVGQWQGRYLCGEPLPRYSWLADDWLGAWVPPCTSKNHRLVHDEQAWTHPLLRDHLGTKHAQSARMLCDARRQLIERTTLLPYTLCHHDCWPPNLHSRSNSEKDVTLVVDWSWVGRGTAGHDAANLVFDAVASGYLPPEQLASTDAAVLEAYLDGISSAGWTGPMAMVRTGYRMVAALRFGSEAATVLALARDEDRLALLAGREGRPAAEMIVSRAAALAQALEHATSLLDTAADDDGWSRARQSNNINL